MAEYSIYDYYDAGFLTITVTPFADKIEQTKQETINVLKDVKAKNVTQQEFDEVLVPLVTSLNTSVKSSNGYWLGLIGHLQNEALPKDIACVTNIPEYYASLTLEDVFYVIDNYLNVEMSVSLTLTSGAVKKRDENK